MIQTRRCRHSGFTLIELMVTMMIGSVLVLGVTNVLSRTLSAREVADIRNDLTRQSRFAMQMMVQSVSQADQNWDESLVFFLSSDNLVQRTPVTWEGDLNDYVEEVIATQVTEFDMSRLPQQGNRAEVIAITLQLSRPDAGVEVNMSTQVRVGSRL